MLTPRDIERIKELRNRGDGIGKISRETGFDKKTIRKYSESSENPAKIPQPPAYSQAPSRQAPGLASINPVSTTSVVRTKESREDSRELRQVPYPRIDPGSEAGRTGGKCIHPEYETPGETDGERIYFEQTFLVPASNRTRQEAEEEKADKEREKSERHRKWVRNWQDWASTWGIFASLPVPADIKFKVRDAVGEVLKNRSEEESRWDIEELVKQTINAVIQPYLEKKKEEEAKKLEARKIQLIQSAFPEIKQYIKEHGLETYVVEEDIKRKIHGHFTEKLKGNETYLYSYQIRNALDSMLGDLKERVKKQKAEAEKRAREEKERQEKIQQNIRIGMDRLNFYLLKNSKELGFVSSEDKEEAKKYLGEELRIEIRGDESRLEIEALADEILESYFFE